MRPSSNRASAFILRAHGSLLSPWDLHEKATSGKTTAKSSSSLHGQHAEEELAKLWQKRGKAWQKRFLIGSCLPEGTKPSSASDPHLANQPWAFAARAGCGCLPCSEAKTGTEWSLGTAGLVPKFRAWFLEKHQASKQRVDAVKVMLGLRTRCSCGSAGGAASGLFSEKPLGSGRCLRDVFQMCAVNCEAPNHYVPDHEDERCFSM